MPILSTLFERAPKLRQANYDDYVSGKALTQYEKPGFWQNLITKGRAGREVNEANRRLYEQERGFSQAKEAAERANQYEIAAETRRLDNAAKERANLKAEKALARDEAAREYAEYAFGAGASKDPEKMYLARQARFQQGEKNIEDQGQAVAEYAATRAQGGTAYEKGLAPYQPDMGRSAGAVKLAEQDAELGKHKLSATETNLKRDMLGDDPSDFKRSIRAGWQAVTEAAEKLAQENKEAKAIFNAVGATVPYLGKLFLGNPRGFAVTEGPRTIHDPKTGQPLTITGSAPLTTVEIGGTTLKPGSELNDPNIVVTPSGTQMKRRLP